MIKQKGLNETNAVFFLVFLGNYLLTDTASLMEFLSSHTNNKAVCVIAVVYSQKRLVS